MDRTAIQIEELYIELGGQTILSNVHMHILEGKINFIIGPNGGGKTTLVRAIMNLIPPKKGFIKIFGKPNSRQQVAKTISYVPQYSSIDRSFPITVYEAVEMVMPNLSRKQIESALAAMEIQEFKERKISSLSGGEFQRVLIARALVGKPKILILDEPTNNLDAKTQNRLFGLVKKLNKKFGLTVILITHDINIISAIAQKVFCINRGLICEGTPHKVLRPEVFRKIYGMPLLEYTHQHKHHKEEYELHH